MRDAPGAVAPADSGERAPFLTYEPYYGLKEKAFSLSSDPRFLYKGEAHAPAYHELRGGIRRREGIIVLTGEPGTGKTTLCRSVLASLDRETFCAFVPDPFLTREDLLKMLLVEFGVLSVDELKSGRMREATRAELSYPLYDFLRSLVPLQAYAVLILDEAQNLSPELLEEIRILSDLEGPEKLLQLVLVGQPELRGKLKDPAMRQVDQRVSIRCSLQPLDRDALPAYIAHRLSVAGSGPECVEFSSEALELLYGASAGTPRVINLLADKSLYHAHLARAWTITPAMVSTALGGLGFVNPAPPAPRTAAVTLPSPSRPLPLEHFPPEKPLPDELPSHPAAPELTARDDGPLFLLEDARGGRTSDREDGDGRRRRLRRAALLAVAGLVVIAATLGLTEWDFARQNPALSLAVPPVPAPPLPPISAGVAPVIAPPQFFAPAAR